MKIMTLRTVTIWTTGVMLIAVVSGALFCLATDWVLFYDFDNAFLWITAGPTLFVSFVVSLNLKYRFPAAILLFSMVGYFAMYVLVLMLTIFVESGTLLPILLFLICIAWFPLMIPVWVFTLVLELTERQENR